MCIQYIRKNKIRMTIQDKIEMIFIVDKMRKRGWNDFDM